MPRTNRIAPGGWLFHVLNRANMGAEIFTKEGDYRAFEHLLGETCERFAMRLLAYCIMPNHWHLVLWPRKDGDLGRFMQRLTTTHARRWRLHRGSVGAGHLYQGTYKSFPIQQDDHVLKVCRYVERNALRASLVARAEDWPWSSLATLLQTAPRTGQEGRPVLSPWPVDRPQAWRRLVNEIQTADEIELLRRAVQRGHPFGNPVWQKQAAKRLGLESTLHPRGRPRKKAVS